MPLTHKNIIPRISRRTEHHHEICEYAEDAYSAIKHSKEDVPYLQAHPSFIDYCNCIPTEIDNLFDIRACGIPFGC